MLLKTYRPVVHHLKFWKSGQPLTVPVRKMAYEAPMSSYMTIINQKDPRRPSVNYITSYSTLGFRLVNDSFIYGPILIFENHVFCWNIRGDDEINEASLAFLFHLHPPLDLIIIGYSHPENKDIHKRNLHAIARKYNCAIELLHVEKAVGTYNFLVENRNVAGALIPPAYMQQQSPSDAMRHFFSLPDTLDVPSYDAEHNFDMIDKPRYQRVEVKKLVSKKKDAKQIETVNKEIQVKEETDNKNKKD